MRSSTLADTGLAALGACAAAQSRIAATVCRTLSPLMSSMHWHQSSDQALSVVAVRLGDAIRELRLRSTAREIEVAGEVSQLCSAADHQEGSNDRLVLHRSPTFPARWCIASARSRIETRLDTRGLSQARRR